MSIWLAVLGFALINFTIKAIAPALLGDRDLPPRVALIVHSVAPALLAGLLIVQVLGQEWRDFDWTLLPGLAVIGVLWLHGRSQVVCILAGVLVCVAIRALL